MKRRQWQEWKIGNFDDFCYPVQTKLQSIHYAQLTTIRLWVVALFTDISGSVVSRSTTLTTWPIPRIYWFGIATDEFLGLVSGNSNDI